MRTTCRTPPPMARPTRPQASSATSARWLTDRSEPGCRTGGQCTAQEYSLSYLNYQIAPLDNLSWRIEFFNDLSGQRTGIKVRYINPAFGWQHWFSPTIMIRPEIAWYNALDRPSFNRKGQGNISGPGTGGATAYSEFVASAESIWHI